MTKEIYELDAELARALLGGDMGKAIKLAGQRFKLDPKPPMSKAPARTVFGFLAAFSQRAGEVNAEHLSLLGGEALHLTSFETAKRLANAKPRDERYWIKDEFGEWKPRTPIQQQEGEESLLLSHPRVDESKSYAFKIYKPRFADSTLVKDYGGTIYWRNTYEMPGARLKKLVETQGLQLRELVEIKQQETA